MRTDRWDRILAEVRQRPAAVPLIAHLCTVARHLLGVDHVSIALHTAQGLIALEGSDPVAGAADRYQNLWGVGPSIRLGSPGTRFTEAAITVHDITAATDPRWPVLAELHTALDLRSLIALPLRTGGARLGALTGYSHHPWSPTSAQLADGLVAATIITEVLLGLRAVDPAPPPTDPPTEPSSPMSPPSPMPPGLRLDLVLDALPRDSLQVHQAAGMLAERLQITIIEAQVRLRALAFQRGDTLEELAGRIISDHSIIERED